MDPVRFGRALGVGARAAAKTVVHAVDAASAANPAAVRQDSPARDPQRAGRAIRGPAPIAGTPPPNPSAAKGGRGTQAAAAATQLKTGARGIREGSRRFGREVWNPFVRLSGVLWLEVTGVFFGIFAAFALAAAWRLRTAWSASPPNPADRQRLFGALVMLAIFGYFSISSFLRARRRERRR